MKPLLILLLVIAAAAVASGLGVLIWWLVTRNNVTTEILDGGGLGVATTAALVRIPGTGSMFWMFHPSEAANSSSQPLVLWLDGVAGLPPSLLANFGMVGPLDFNMNKRNGSWVEELNLLFVDAPLGTGFSSASSDRSLAADFNETSKYFKHSHIVSIYPTWVIQELNLLFVDAPLGTGFSSASSDSSLAADFNETTLPALTAAWPQTSMKPVSISNNPTWVIQELNLLFVDAPLGTGFSSDSSLAADFNETTLQALTAAWPQTSMKPVSIPNNPTWVIQELNLLFVDAPLGTGFSSANSESSLAADFNETSKFIKQSHIVSMVEELNLLFVDAPLGTGFSSASSDTSLAADFNETTRQAPTPAWPQTSMKPVSCSNIPTWVIQELNLLFVDAPLGTGFSSANSESSLAADFNETSNSANSESSLAADFNETSKFIKQSHIVSMVEELNLLFVDAPLGTGFSSASSDTSLAADFNETTQPVPTPAWPQTSMKPVSISNIPTWVIQELNLLFVEAPLGTSFSSASSTSSLAADFNETIDLTTKKADLDQLFSRMGEFEIRLKNATASPAPVHTDLKTLAGEYADFKNWQALNQISAQTNLLSLGLENNKAFLRRKVLLFHVVAETKDERLAEVIAKVMGDKMQLSDIPSSDLQACHRLADHLLYVLESFYNTLGEYQKTPLYIYGQGDGAQLALHLADRIQDREVSFDHNLQGVILANPIISPALALTKLGFYLDEMGYVDPTGRVVVEEFVSELNALVDAGQMEEAFDKFLTLESFLNEEVGTAAINLRHLIQKLTRGTSSRDYFGHKQYLRSALQLDFDVNQFMSETVAPALGISGVSYDEWREAAMQALKGVYMAPKTDLVEDILSNTNLSVTIINGNLDAVSNTPGQLEWVNNLQWSGQSEFVDSYRLTLIVNGLVEGYFRGANFGTGRLTFYWMNAAGVSVPLDSPVAARRVIQRITGI
ncbi:serine carboxypeptidase domain-containing protein [Phthorimaea operculella]|nr:serine carboxypeptidase domain-containing protein [Phthorimaea operculella]